MQQKILYRLRVSLFLTAYAKNILTLDWAKLSEAHSLNYPWSDSNKNPNSLQGYKNQLLQ
jgi:hypothetical protein